MKKDRVSIISETLSFGSDITSAFEKTAEQEQMTIAHKWIFNPNHPKLDTRLKQITNELKKVNDPGVIFLAVHSQEGIKLVKLIKDLEIKNIIIGPDSFASKSFSRGFDQLVTEKKKPGFYSNGIYTATPLIFDTASETAQQFKENYKRKYGEEPAWSAAFAYDSAQIIVQAIKNTGVTGTEKTLNQDRIKIRNYLASITTSCNAVKGITGLNYFDKDGNTSKPVSIGVYKSKNIISALTQLQEVPGFTEPSELTRAIEKKQILQINNKYMFKTNVVYAGVRINKISDIDLKKSLVKLDFMLWFRFQGDIDTSSIRFLNSVENISLDKPLKKEKCGLFNYHLYHVKGLFRIDFLPGDYAFGQHLLGASFQHKNLSRNNLIYVVDFLGMGVTGKNSLKSQSENLRILNSMKNWDMKGFRFFQSIEKQSILGHPRLLNAEGGMVEFSQFNMGLWIKKSSFMLRGKIPDIYAKFLFIISLISVVFMEFFWTQKSKNYFPKLIWILQNGMWVLFLVCSEVIVMGFLSKHLSLFYLQKLSTFFAIFWWILPAHMLNLGIKFFIWNPLEKRTNRKVPNIVRHFTSVMIYLLALFGIIAFIFDQKVTSLLATSGIVAMIVGLAIQTNIANIFSGIIINLEEPFRIGNWIRVDSSTEGQVIDITWRSTRILDGNGSIISIPNSKAAESTILNFNYPKKSYAMSLMVHINPIHTPDKIIKILNDAVSSIHGIIKNPEPAVKFKGISEWAADYSVKYWVPGFDQKDKYSELIWKSIWKHLKLADISTAVQLEIPQDENTENKESINALSVLEDIDIFSNLSNEEFDSLSEQMEIKIYPPGESIVKQNESGSSLFIIAQGAVSVLIEMEDEKNLEVNRLGAGDLFGETALLTGAKRGATINALTETKAYEVKKEHLAPILDKNPDLALAMSKILAQRQKSNASTKSSGENQIKHKKNEDHFLLKIQKFFGLERKKPPGA